MDAVDYEGGEKEYLPSVADNTDERAGWLADWWKPTRAT